MVLGTPGDVSSCRMRLRPGKGLLLSDELQVAASLTITGFILGLSIFGRAAVI